MLIFLLILSGLFLNIQEKPEEESALMNEKYPVVEYQNITELYDLLNQGLVEIWRYNVQNISVRYIFLFIAGLKTGWISTRFQRLKKKKFLFLFLNYYILYTWENQ